MGTLTNVAWPLIIVSCVFFLFYGKKTNGHTRGMSVINKRLMSKVKYHFSFCSSAYSVGVRPKCFLKTVEK